MMVRCVPRKFAVVVVGVAGLAGGASAQCIPGYVVGPVVPMGSGAFTVGVGDLGGDGVLDLVTTSTGASSTVFATGPDYGGQVGSWPLGVPPLGVAVGDVNHDGRADVVSVGGTTGQGVVSVRVGGVEAFRGALPSFPRLPVIGDLNGDGHPDLACALPVTGSVEVYFGDGTGGFVHAPSLPVGSGANGVVMVDADRDGRLDLVVSRGGNQGIVVLRNLGGGIFGGPVNTGAGSGTFSVVADFNNDGILDIATGNQALHAVFVRLGDGVGSFGPALTLPVPGFETPAWQVATADVNYDGRADLIVPLPSANAVAVYTGDGHGGFGAPLTFPSGGAGPSAVAVADMNGDGVPDLVVANSVSNNVVVLYGTLHANPVITDQPVPAAAALGGAAEFTVGAIGAAFEWRRNGVPVVEGGHFGGVRTNHLTVTAVTPVEAGAYTCVVTGCSGVSVTSDEAALMIGEPCAIDFNQDGFVDFFDYDDFVAAFEAGC